MNNAQKAGKTRAINKLEEVKVEARQLKKLATWLERHCYRELRRLRKAKEAHK